MDDKTKFIIYCLEIYRKNKNISGAEAFDIFLKYDLFSYIREFYSVLTIDGPNYLFNDFEQYIKHHSNAHC